MTVLRSPCLQHHTRVEVLGGSESHKATRCCCAMCLAQEVPKTFQLCIVPVVVTSIPLPFYREELMNHAIKLGSQIAARSPVAMQGSKVNLNYARDHTVAQALEYQVYCWNCFKGPHDLHGMV